MIKTSEESVPSDTIGVISWGTADLSGTLGSSDFANKNDSRLRKNEADDLERGAAEAHDQDDRNSNYANGEIPQTSPVGLTLGAKIGLGGDARGGYARVPTNSVSGLDGGGEFSIARSLGQVVGRLHRWVGRSPKRNCCLLWGIVLLLCFLLSIFVTALGHLVSGGGGSIVGRASEKVSLFGKWHWHVGHVDGSVLSASAGSTSGEHVHTTSEGEAASAEDLTYEERLAQEQEAVALNGEYLLKTKAAIKHCFDGYAAKGWGKDRIQPITGEGSDWIGLAITLLDSLDTLYLAGLTEEFQKGVDFVRTLNMANERSGSFFEISIRALGGLLGAYTLSGEKILLKKAEELGEVLLHNGYYGGKMILPDTSVKLKALAKPLGDAPPPYLGGRTTLAEAGSEQLE